MNTVKTWAAGKTVTPRGYVGLMHLAGPQLALGRWEMARSRHSASTRKSSGATESGALTPPKDFHDADWSEKIEIAKEAKAAGAELRKGKPATFSTRHAVRGKTK